MKFNRIQFFEIEDQPWCPQFLRQGVVDFLQGIVGITNLFEPARKIVLRLNSSAQTQSCIDLCSGSGGPWPEWLRKDLELPKSILFTDLYPQSIALPENERTKVSSFPRSISAMDVPPDLIGTRTLFNGFHHFPPQDAKKILSSAAASGQPIAIFECNQRHWMWFAYCAILPIVVMVVTPFLRRLTLSKIVFTYLLPIIPIVVMFDGIISGLRTYNLDELEELTQNLQSHKYQFLAGHIPLGPLPIGITYLVGTPRKTGNGVLENSKIGGFNAT